MTCLIQSQMSEKGQHTVMTGLAMLLPPGRRPPKPDGHQWEVSAEDLVRETLGP